MGLFNHLSKRRLLVAGVPLALIGARAVARTASTRLKQRFYSRANPNVDSLGASVHDLPRDLTSEQWCEDLRYLAEKMPERFIYFDDFVDRGTFDSLVEEFGQKIPSLSRDQIILELMRIIALTNAGHTLIFPWQPAIDWRVLPLRLHIFDDGVYVIDASRRYRRAIGARVLKIGNANIDRVLEETSPYLAADNDSHAKQVFCSRLAPFPEVYRAFGHTANATKTRFLLEDDEGHQFSLDVKAASLDSPMAAMSIWPMYTYESGIRPPAMVTDRSIGHRFEFWEDSKTIYFQFNNVRNNSDDDTIADFTEQLEQFVETHEFDRLIVDLRHNGGGDNTLVKPLVELFSRNKDINQQGKLFIIMDRETFSAAVSFATALERRTKAIFVGEPSGGTPNTIGDADPLIVLPNSQISVRLSWRYWQQAAPEDNRPWMYPDIPVGLTHHDYFEGRDTALEAILSYQPKPVEEVELDDAQMDRFIGRYLFNPNQLLTVSRRRDRLEMAITDFEEFVKADLYPVSETRLASDITDVELHLSNDADAPLVSWKGVEIPLRRVLDDFKVPIQLLQDSSLDEAIEAFRKNKTDGVRLDSRFEFAITAVGLDYLQSGKREEAIKVFRLCLEMLPLSALGLERMLSYAAQQSLEDGEHGKARVLLACNAKLFPDSDTA